jgi:pyruvyl transferase EpsO
MSTMNTVITHNKETLNILMQTLVENFKEHLYQKKVVFVDYPMHLNVGDLLIAKGTEELFDILDVSVLDRLCVRNYQRLMKRKLGDDVVIVLHGGGNFGDLYPHHQTLREEMIKAFPNNKILIMPQSVHYNDMKNLEANKDLFKHHKKLFMYVRDEYSYEVMTPYFEDDKLKKLPDMAFVSVSTFSQCSEKADENTVLKLSRRDIEASSVGCEENTFDWDDIFTAQDYKIYNFARFLTRVENKLSLNLKADLLWKKYSENVIKRAVKIFNQYQTVDTDRLHGMILTLLLEKNVIMRDNSYGKLGRFAKLWLGLGKNNEQ